MSGQATVQCALQRFAPSGLDAHRRKITRRLCACHTPAMGGIEARCEACGDEPHWYHGCRDRHCPQCQGRATRRWAERQHDQLLPVRYFHVVFTLPHDLNGWVELHPDVCHIGVIQSLLVTCLLHDVNPYTYLIDVLQRIGQHPASRVDELVPRVWKEKFGDHPLVSDLHRIGQ